MEDFRVHIEWSWTSTEILEMNIMQGYLVHLQPVKIWVSFKQEAFSIRDGGDRGQGGEGDDGPDGVECSQCGVVGHGTP